MCTRLEVWGGALYGISGMFLHATGRAHLALCFGKFSIQSFLVGRWKKTTSPRGPTR